ncbi:MAG: hypothetical protein LBD35_07670 [Prevotellaceae bacterium]|jgi:hypothetical protein|nr:hypothetical protein [Prevotellaceae bacterium]
MNTDSRYGIILPKGGDAKIVSTIENDESTLLIKPPCNIRYSRIILDFSGDSDDSPQNPEMSPKDSENILRYEPASGDLVQPFRETPDNDPAAENEAEPETETDMETDMETGTGLDPEPDAEPETRIEREQYCEANSQPETFSVEQQAASDESAPEAVELAPETTELTTKPDRAAPTNPDYDLALVYADVEQRMKTLTAEISTLILKAEQMLTRSENRMNEIEAELREHVRQNELRHENSEKLLGDLDEDLKEHLRINEIWRESSESMLKGIVSDVKEHVRRNDERNGYTDGMLKKIVSNTDDLSRRHVEEVQFLYEELQKREKDLFREIQLPVTLDFIEVINNLRNVLSQSKTMDEEYVTEYLARELESCVKFADGRLGNRRITAFSDLKDPNNPPRFSDARHVIERRGIVFTGNRALHDSIAESVSPGYEWHYDDSRSRVIRKETVKIFEYKKDYEFNKLRL